MSTFRLKPTVKLEHQAGGPRLRDVMTGRAMVLSHTEAHLLSALGPELSTDEVVHRVDVDQGLVLALFTRLAASGFLDTEARPTPKPAPVPASTEVVPCIRNDLDFAPGRKAGMVEVRDPKKHRSFTLYDFEANIARMLDGRRTVKEVADHAEKLGIETSPEALKNFFRQLKAFDFFADQPVPLQPARGRKPWLPEIREMYRHALRHSRRDELQQAVEYLEALLQVDPDVSEARDLLDQVQARQRGASSPGLSFQALHGSGQHHMPEDVAHSPNNPFTRFDTATAGATEAPALRSTRHAPTPPAIAPTMAPPEAPESADTLVRPSANSLPPLWTVSTVVSTLTLPEVGDSVLAFDPMKAKACVEPKKVDKKPAAEPPDVEVPWDWAANEG